MTIVHSKTKYNIGYVFDAAAGQYETCRLAIRDSLYLLRLRSSVARLPSCFCTAETRP